MKHARTFRVLLLLLLCGGGGVSAHESGFTTLHMKVDRARITGEWELTFRDARALLGQDPDAAGADRELREAEVGELARLFARRIGLVADGAACPLDPVNRKPEEASSGRDAIVLTFLAACAGPVRELRIRYSILFDLDPAHRGYFSVEDGQGLQVGVFNAERPEALVDVRRFDRAQAWVDYGREGLWHVWSGMDHMLFLVALLLPSVFAWSSRSPPQPRERLRPVVVDVLRIVTAFTVAHSITLSLAVLGALRLPPRPVEVVIAGSVLVAAWNNLRPFLPGRGGWIALAFGLVHGLGFAGALVQLGLPQQARGLALLAFNVGVEIGQLAIVGALLPVLFAVRKTKTYRTWGLRGISFLIAWLAAIWLIERSLRVNLLPWI